MSESKVFQALVEFKAKYAWDKSLVTDNTPVSAPALGADLGDYSLRDFVAAAQSKASAREAHETS